MQPFINTRLQPGDHWTKWNRSRFSGFQNLTTKIAATAALLLSLSLTVLRAQPVNAGVRLPQPPTNAPAVSDRTRQAAEHGDAKAQYEVAVSEYETAKQWQWFVPGPPLPPPERSAAREKWAAAPEAEARQAAAKGDRGALWFVNDQDSKRAAESRARGLEWLKKAAAQKYAPAEFWVAESYINGRLAPGSTQEQEGLELLRDSMEQGYESAQHRWAQLLLEGGWLAPDLPRALDLLRRAADQKCPRAQFDLAQQYTSGNGEARSADETPVELLTRAANAGLADAQFALGERSRFGFGLEQNRARACFWYTLAASGGSREADVRLRKLQPALTPQETAQVASWVSTWKVKAGN